MGLADELPGKLLWTLSFEGLIVFFPSPLLLA
jgi:hypothetical protein